MEDGEVIESTIGAAPLELTLGDGRIIPGLEKGIIGMSPGESKSLYIPAEEAHGLRDENKVFEFDRSRAPEGFDPVVGQQVRMYRPDGKEFIVTVIEITEKGFKMDANHPLAGKDLIFDLELLEIVS
jgi:peptidylprolyl isomerase